MGKSKIYLWRTLASFILVLFTMPLGHAFMVMMEKAITSEVVHYAGFIMGFVGLIMVAIGVFVKGDTRQTPWGLIGGLFFWTGWIEFLFQYYIHRFGVQPETENGEIVTKPEYLILPASFGFWMMMMTMYIFSTRNGCNFITWIQKRLLGKRKNEIAFQLMTCHISIITFAEVNMILWASYLLLMFCYDKNFLGDHHSVTFLVGIDCFFGAPYMLKKQLYIAPWGANIRMAVATAIVFRTPVEILGCINFFKELWAHPQEYAVQLLCILVAFILLTGYMWLKGFKKKIK